MTDQSPVLYVKSGCSYCTEAVEFLDKNGIEYKVKDVSADVRAFDEMRQKSGQTKAPTLDWNGKVLADFGLEELLPFLRKENIKFEDS